MIKILILFILKQNLYRCVQTTQVICTAALSSIPIVVSDFESSFLLRKRKIIVTF